MENEPASLSPSRATLLDKQIKREWWWVTLCLVLLSVLLSFYRVELNIKRLDLTFYDLQIKSVNDKKTLNPSEIALVIVDDDSLHRLGYWPWRRVEYARALNYLNEAKVIGLDILFQDKNPAYPKDDAVLAHTMASLGNVVLPSFYNDTESDATHLPIAPLKEAAASIGYINVPPDRDGVVRRTLLHKEPHQLHFSLAMLQAAQDTDILNSLLEEPHKASRLLSFRGPPGSFDTYSFADLVEGKYDPKLFKDRYVLIGAWSSGLGDFYPTPTSSDEQTSMSGVEILANTLENALHDHWIYALPNWVVIPFTILPTLLICIMLKHLRPRRAIISTAAILVGVLTGSWVLLNVFHLWLPPTVGLIVTILAYPVWYWRSQEAVLKHINNEIADMRRHDPALSIALKNTSKHSSLPERLSHLHKAIELLRQTQSQREETLHFLSHDMRAPQNSILALIEMKRNQQLNLPTNKLLDHVESYAKSTLNLVDNFINLAKVEAMELHLQLIFLNDLLVDVFDDAWIRAQAKHISVKFEEPEEGVWVNAAPQLLKRAFSNLIDNAIKYSDENTTIRASVHIDKAANRVKITLSDEGWGIPTEAVPTIFQQFKRAHAEHKNTPNGSGLGLAFVQTVILRHLGEITVSSEEKVGTTFSIYLPLA